MFHHFYSLKKKSFTSLLIKPNHLQQQACIHHKRQSLQIVYLTLRNYD